ncbi:hypothetical protein [Kitasatospora sp. CB01950]|uniref:hypothetical protein n=1 Tax=Kitasatospora sp. CB01950 TaxID=1703930 RepID=UPI00093CA306|nr:hypothetical protein [Kitasatospora sp. CB01950]OKJ05282.1 hypothetical protein AMK19_26235 [Kitasatospora sp. CB01950]
MSTPAPWVRTRLRTAPLAALLTGALALTVVFLAAALPRAQDRGADGALHSFLRTAGPTATSIQITAAVPTTGDPSQQLDTTAGRLTDTIDPVLPLDPSGPVYGRRAGWARSLGDPALDRPEGVEPEFAVQYQHGTTEHARLTAGQWPGAAAEGEPIPVAVSEATARTVKLTLGTVYDGGKSVQDRNLEKLRPQRIKVVGLYTVDNPSDPFWDRFGCAVTTCMNLTPSSGPGDPPERYWYAVALTGPEGMSRIADWGRAAEDYWRMPVRVDALRADRLRETSYDLAAVTTGPVGVKASTSLGRSNVRITTELRTLVDNAWKRQSAIDSLAYVGPAGAAGVAAVVLCLAAALTAERRTTELRLLRARGASTRGIWQRLLGEGALTVLPAAGLGALLAFTLLPTPRWLPAAVAAGSVTLLALLAFPVRTALMLRVKASAGPSGRRRLLAELGVLVATTAAVTQVVRRGVAPLGEGVDPLLVTAPLLVALTGALLLARLQPALIGLLARWAGRRPGVIGFLGLARAARGSGPRSRPSMLPLLALVLAVTCGAIGSTVLSSVAAQRSTVARYNIGADVMVGAGSLASLPDDFVAAAERLPGADVSLPVWVDEDVVLVTDGNWSARVNIVVADPVKYAKIAEVAGRGRFDPSVLTGPVEPGGPIPAVVSSDLPKGRFDLRLAGGEAVPIRSVAVADGTPALNGSAGTTVVLPLSAVTDLMPRFGSPHEWLAAGNVDDTAVRALAEKHLGPPAVGTKPGHQVRTRAGEVGELAKDPLQSSAERRFWVSVGATALFALLSVLLTLFRAGPERAATLARLRTMGLRPRQGLALILAEALPHALVAALGGALTAVCCVLMLGPAVDIAPLVGASDPTGLRLTAAPILQQALGLALLAALAVLAETAVTARRQITTELRAGDNR